MSDTGNCNDHMEVRYERGEINGPTDLRVFHRFICNGCGTTVRIAETVRLTP